LADILQKLADAGDAAFDSEQLSATRQGSHESGQGCDLQAAFPHVACAVSAATEVWHLSCVLHRFIVRYGLEWIAFGNCASEVSHAIA
jgi:hypothetical protein